MTASSNFVFLKEHDPVFLQLASTAEQVFASDPNTTQSDLPYKLSREIQLDQNIRSLFHTLRGEGNRATQPVRTQHREATDGLKVARALAIWYHQSFGKSANAFKPGPFATPADPSSPLRDLQNQIDQLKAQLSESSQQLESNQQLAELMTREATEYAVLAEQMDAESREHKQLALTHEAELNRLRAAVRATPQGPATGTGNQTQGQPAAAST